MRVTHEWTDTTATIRTDAVTEAVRILHVTDSHIALIDERDGEHLDAGRGHREKFSKYRSDAAGSPIFTEVTFPETLLAPQHGKLDLLALSGDIVQFPAAASLEAATAAIGKLGVPFLYTSGNHDWLFSDEKPSDEVRRRYWPALNPLTAGEPAFSVRDIKGVRFIAVDNSNYQVDGEQLEKTRAALEGRTPTVILIHIPISLPTLRPETIQRWKAPILIDDPDWDVGSRNNWGARRDDRPTGDFVRLLMQAPNVIAVLCGHIHFPHADTLHGRAVQYVGKPGFEGGYRLIEIRRMK